MKRRYRRQVRSHTVLQRCRTEMSKELSDRVSIIARGPGPLLLFTLLFLLFFSPILVSGSLLAPGDAWFQSIPSFFAPFSIWTRDILGGYPLIADPQAQLWYPVRYLFPKTVTGFNLFVVSAYVMAAYFTFGFLRSAGSTNIGALTGALLFSLSGFMVSNLCHIPIVHAAAYIPLVLWAFTELKKNRATAKWSLIAIAGLSCSILAGHPQTLVYSYYLYILFIGAQALILGGREAGKFVLRTAAILSLAPLICAISLMPMLELSEQCTRGNLPFGSYTSYNLPLAQIASVFFPTIFGIDHGAEKIDFLNSLGVKTYFGQWDFQSTAAFLGSTAIALGLTGILGQRKRKAIWFWTAVAIISLVFALGDSTFFSIPAFYLPGLSYFRCPARALLFFNLSLAVLTSLGVSSLSKNLASTKVTACAIALTAVLAATSLIAPIQSTRLGYEDLLSPSILFPLSIFIVSSVVLILAARARKNKVFISLIPALVIMELVIFFYVAPWIFNSRTAISPPINSQLAEITRDLKRRNQRLLSVRGIDGNPEEIPPNSNRLLRLSSASGYQPLLPKRYRNLMGVTPGGMLDKPPPRAALNLDIMAVRFVITPKDSPDLDPVYRSIISSIQEDSEHFLERDPGEDSTIRIFENTRDLPLAWLVDETVAMRPYQTLTTILESRFEPEKTALVEADPTLVPRKNQTSLSSIKDSAPKIIKLEDCEVIMETDCDSKSFLVFSDIFYPGWQATINEAPAELIRTNYVMRGLSLPAGRNRIIFQYKPESLKQGALLSLFGIFLSAILACLLHRKERHRH